MTLAEFKASLSSATPPAGLSQEQFKALVDAISDSVTEKLKGQGTVPAADAKTDSKAPPISSAKGSKPPAGPKIIVTTPKEGPNAFAVFIEDARQVWRATPVMLSQIGLIPGLLDQRGILLRGLVKLTDCARHPSDAVGLTL